MGAGGWGGRVGECEREEEVGEFGREEEGE